MCQFTTLRCQLSCDVLMALPDLNMFGFVHDNVKLSEILTICMYRERQREYFAVVLLHY